MGPKIVVCFFTIVWNIDVSLPVLNDTFLFLFSLCLNCFTPMYSLYLFWYIRGFLSNEILATNINKLSIGARKFIKFQVSTNYCTVCLFSVQSKFYFRTVILFIKFYNVTWMIQIVIFRIFFVRKAITTTFYKHFYIVATGPLIYNKSITKPLYHVF